MKWWEETDKQTNRKVHLWCTSINQVPVSATIVHGYKKIINRIYSNFSHVWGCRIKLWIELRWSSFVVVRKPYPILAWRPFFWDLGKQCRPRTDAEERGVRSGLHCLLTEISIKNRIKMKQHTRCPLHWNWTRPFDKDGKHALGKCGLTLYQTNPSSSWWLQCQSWYRSPDVRRAYRIIGRREMQQ